ncbi:DUF2460 domain-containing protein [Sphingomonas prati]|uniref:Uncharacterized protein (TIGR02217 family) n=1 Tax=Sphingomonas prati TaxID=1843237 RepID=A0A7W9F457_9SPHN|nr:DUF2460 domain-containing protein [Sphingomonas prati]MBB5730564.1 uncharacterized protein (TIGR02217 family) [Sphingomonas prati]GGE95000.1 hypothetical protein GCM10011404_30130 [Sphingomonas prati]
MGWRLASERTETRYLKRFDVRFWTVDFPRPVMASVVTTGPHALRVDAVFYNRDDLAGLIWASEDRWDHPLASYETDRDYRECSLRFRWRSGGIRALDAINGPTLTIEGRDAAGQARAWYVRLSNYAVGDPEDAVVSIDFARLDGGFLLPAEADPVWAGDIDRMFVSLVAPDYDPAGGALAAPAEGWVEISDMRCDGAGSVLALGDAMVPAHAMRIATGYDDAYNLTPERVLRNAVLLGYREVINHYVGMSHYFRLEQAGNNLLVSLRGGVLNVACESWHRDFAMRCKSLGYRFILSLSYELFDAHAWGDWKQRTEGGAPALTGWVPPSTLLSPAHEGAMGYLHQVGRAFVRIAVAAGLEPWFQVGEPWWWVAPGGQPCLYDAAARAVFGAGLVSIADVAMPMDAAQRAMLDQAGALLAASTLALRDAVRAEAPGCRVALLVYLPTVLDRAAPELRRANVPMGWARPAFDVLQLEDYDWVTTGNSGATARGVDAMTARLGYPIDEQQYFSGFVLNREASAEWRAIDAAAEAGRARGIADVFIWALPQVARDGFVHWDTEGEAMTPFDDVDFPIALGRQASVSPNFSTAVVTSASGHEQRNADWAEARMRYDAGPGVRSDEDAQTLIAFFRARRGAAKGFRLRDPYDDSSAGMTDAPAYRDQRIGVGDGKTTRFALIKSYGDGEEAQLRRITRPVAGSVRVGVDGAALIGGWTLDPGGTVVFDAAPGVGAVVTAGFRFDVPVRFAEDRIDVSRATYLAGEMASVPMIEIRET